MLMFTNHKQFFPCMAGSFWGNFAKVSAQRMVRRQKINYLCLEPSYRCRVSIHKRLRMAPNHHHGAANPSRKPKPHNNNNVQIKLVTLTHALPQATSPDWKYRKTFRGYGSVCVPPVPGRHVLYVQLFVPKASTILQVWLGIASTRVYPLPMYIMVVIDKVLRR